MIEIANGKCDVGAENKGDAVKLHGHATRPGSSGKGGAGAPGASGTLRSDDWSTDDDATEGMPPIHRDEFGVVPAVTLRDIRSFHPAPGTDHMQPDGWMIVGLDTNFYSIVRTQVVKGKLLGQSASVRFTPVAWHWRYGDGARADRATAGGTWKAQDIREFDPTPTSHVYRRPGTYYIDLSIDFAAEYAYADAEWIPVTGTITLPANRLKATAVKDAKTVLVNRDCAQNPSGPGC